MVCIDILISVLIPERFCTLFSFLKVFRFALLSLEKAGGRNNQKPSCCFIKELGLSEEVIGKCGILFPWINLEGWVFLSDFKLDFHWVFLSDFTLIQNGT